MNKLMGFYELKDMALPSVPWEEYTGKEKFSSDKLWTIRSAVYRGGDLNLPRLVGAKAEEAEKFARELLKQLENRGMVVYYPYFLANKSGNLVVFNDKIVIEAVEKDLWNLVTLSDREVTIQIEDTKTRYNGNRDFLSEMEINKLLAAIPAVKQKFRDDIIEGKGIMFEWSFAQEADLYGQPQGSEYLVFYEARTIS